MSQLLLMQLNGMPVPQGSFRPMLSRSTGKPFVKQDEGLLRYRADLRASAERHMDEQGVTLMLWAVRVDVTFILPRPAYHFLPANTRRAVPLVKPGAPAFPVGPPDLDKLCRAVLDALTGIVYADDAQVIGLYAAKAYTDETPALGLTALRITGGNDPDVPRRTDH